MNVLVTGGAGYIGSHTVVELLNAGHEAVIVDDLSNAKADVIDRIETITGKRPAFHQIDCADGAALRSVFASRKIDAVIHFAGFKAVGESVKKPLEYYRNNLDSTMTLLEVMEEFGCKKFIFSSSATVYGPNNPHPYKEDMPAIQSSSPYGWTKVMIERILTDYVTAHPDFCAILLRYFNPIGAHESGLLGDDPNGIPNNLMPYIGRVAAGQLEKLTIFGDPAAFTVPDYKTVPSQASVFFRSGGKGPLSRLADSVKLHMFTPFPKLRAKDCVGCKKCANICPAKAITMKRGKPRIDRKACIHCFCCQEFCPKGAMVVGRTALAKLLEKG